MRKTIAGIGGYKASHVDMTEEEIALHLADEEKNKSSRDTENLIEQAKLAMNRSDMIAIRCLKSNVPFPQEWKDYTSSLRAIINGASGPIPTQPKYPEGT